MSLRRPPNNAFINSRNNFYDTSNNDQKYSILYTPTSLSRKPIYLKDLEKYVIIQKDGVSAPCAYKPSFANNDYGVDHYTDDVDLNDLLWEVLVGDGDLSALSLNMMRITTTFKDGYAKVTRFGLYTYSEDQLNHQDHSSEIHHTMNLIDLMARALFNSNFITARDLTNNHERFISMWLEDNRKHVSLTWNHRDILEKDYAPIRMSTAIIKKYITTKLGNLFNWLQNVENSFGGQVMHIKYLMGIYYITRFGMQAGAYSNKAGGGIIYSLPNLKKNAGNYGEYNYNSIGRSWACAELLITLFRTYDPMRNYAVYLLPQDDIDDTNENTDVVGDIMETTFKTMTLSRNRNGKSKLNIADVRQVIPFKEVGKTIVRCRDNTLVELDDNKDSDVITAIANGVTDGSFAASNEFKSHKPRPKPSTSKSKTSEPIYEEPIDLDTLRNINANESD